MKIKVRFFITGVMAAILVTSCSENKNRQESQSAERPDAWPEMEAFHEVMAAVYHPYIDSANLEPARRLAEQLAADAEKWSNSTIPLYVDNPEIKSQLQKLKDDARAWADLVKTGAQDGQTGKQLSELHENFHSIMEAVRPKGD